MRKNAPIHEEPLSFNNKQKYCFIINDSKQNARDLAKIISEVCEEYNIVDYYFSYTTPENNGNLQAREAIDNNTDIIVAVGGDGTVRSVICGIIKSSNPHSHQVELGVIPNGTGNVLAHNVGLIHDDPQLALRNIIMSSAKKIDVGVCRSNKESDFKQIFVTISGVGYDANMVKHTKSDQKDKFGPFAYYIAGIKEAFKPKIKAEIELTLLDNKVLKTNTELRTLMVANCGNIPGFTLVPNAKLDDGLFDVIAIDTKGGLLGWMQLGAEVILQRFGVKFDNRYKLGRIEHIQCREVTINLSKPSLAQLDGDLINKTDYMNFQIIPNAISLRY